MNRTELFATLAGAMARPFIPELHKDDCFDVECVRCVPRLTNPIERLDVPLAVVSAEAILLEARARHTQAKDWDEAELVANAEAIQLVTHPEAPVSTNDTYREWVDALAARTAKTGGTR